MKRVVTRQFLADFLFIGVGTALYSAALTIFLQPSAISPGGVTGLASLTGQITRLPTGVLTAVLNLPLIIWGFRRLGGSFVLRTAVATLIMSVWIDLFDALLPHYSGDRLLAALYGGFLGGAGLAMVFLRGGSTGGTDIAAKIIAKRWPQFSVGKGVLLLDGIIILLVAVVYSSFESALYTTLTIFISTRVIDSVLCGNHRGKLAVIITDRPKEVTEAIFDNLERGVTHLQATGGYSHSPRTMIMCAVRVNEVTALRRAVAHADEGAFAVIAEAAEILGEGFGDTT